MNARQDAIRTQVLQRLGNHSPADQMAVAFRATMRVAPLFLYDAHKPGMAPALLHFLRVRLAGAVASGPSPVNLAVPSLVPDADAPHNHTTDEIGSVSAFETVPPFGRGQDDASPFAFVERYIGRAATTAETPSFDGSAADAVWSESLADVDALTAGLHLDRAPLWQGTIPGPLIWDNFSSELEPIKDRMIQTDFWARWWKGLYLGQPLDRDLQEAVALMIPDAIWAQGHAAVAEAIRVIEATLEVRHDDDVEIALAALPPAGSERIARFSKAVTKYHEQIPPTIEALLEFCSLEINRLQGRNAPYATPEEEAEAQRQIRVLTTIYSTLQKLRATIPENGVLTAETAERGEKLTRLFVRSFKVWPRKRVQVSADSANPMGNSAGLVALTATLGPMVGFSLAVAPYAGAILFGSKTVLDGSRAAKDLKDLAP